MAHGDVVPLRHSLILEGLRRDPLRLILTAIGLELFDELLGHDHAVLVVPLLEQITGLSRQRLNRLIVYRAFGSRHRDLNVSRSEVPGSPALEGGILACLHTFC